MANINLEVSAGQSKTITFQSAGKYTTEDIVFNVTGAAGSTTIAASSGTNQITLAHGTKYAITAAGSSYVFTMPSQYTHPSYTATEAGAYKIGNDATGHVVIGAALAKGDVGLGNVENKSSATIRAEITSSNVTNALGFTPATSNHTHSYLPLAGGEMTGKIVRKYTSASNSPAIHVLSKNLDTYIWKVDDYDTTGYGFGLKYIGTGTENNNDLVLLADNQAQTQKEAFRVHQDSTVIFGTTPRVGDVAVSLSNHTHSGYKTTQTAVSDPTASSTTSTTFIDSISQNANGVITATKKTLPAYASTSHTHTTSIATSTGTNKITLAFGTKYAITAGGTSYVFTMPGDPNTDSNVQQDDFSNSANWHYPLLSNNYSSGALDGINDGDTGPVGFSIKLAVNPSEGSIYTAGYVQSESGFVVTGRSGFLMADGGVNNTSYASSNHAHIGYAASSHSHGSITSDGAISSGTALANGDSIVFSDSSDGSKLKKSTITFDGSTTTKFLSQKGTWETPSGGGESTVVGKTVELSPSSQALITVNGSDSGEVKLPDTCPWVADPANHNDIIGGVTPIFRANRPDVIINGNVGDFSGIKDVSGVKTLFLFPNVARSKTLFALPVVMDGEGHLFVLISENLASDVFLNNGMSTDAGALSGE